MTAYGYCECGCGTKTPIATKTDRGVPQAKGQPKRFVAGHNLRMVPKLTPVSPAWALEDRGFRSQCWIWTGSIASAGYGEIRNPVRQLAHRWSYEYHVGSIPEGLHIDHLCYVRPCVNPEHLEPVTPAENNCRALAHNRAEKKARPLAAA